MAFDGIQCDFFDRNIVLYKCDTGISNLNNSIWTDRLKKDVCETDKIILESISDDYYRKLFKSAISFRENRKMTVSLAFYFRNLKVLFWKIRIKLLRRNTSLKYDKQFFDRCNNGN